MPAQIYVLATKIFQLLQFYPSNYQVAAALSVLLMIVTIAAIWLQRYIVGRHSHTSITGKGYRPRQMPLGALALAGLRPMHRLFRLRGAAADCWRCSTSR